MKEEARIPLEWAIEFMNAQIGEIHGVSGVIFYASDILYYLQKLADMPEIVRCRDCEFYTKNVFSSWNGMPVIVAHCMCSKWGNGCATDPEGFCFMGKRKEDEMKKD